MTVVFYISGHGFGHASRDGRDHQRAWPAAARPAHHHPIGRRPRPAGPHAHGRLRPAAGRVRHRHRADVAASRTTTTATVEAAIDFYGRLARPASTPSAPAAGDPDVRLIVGDIPPLAFEVAARLSVPSVAIANFTWDWIYETHPGLAGRGALAAADSIREAYRKPRWRSSCRSPAASRCSRIVRPIPLVARRPTSDRARTRARTSACRSIGPRCCSPSAATACRTLDLRSLDCLDEWTVVTTDRITPPRTALPRERRLCRRGGVRRPGLPLRGSRRRRGRRADEARLRHRRRVHHGRHGDALHVARPVPRVRRARRADCRGYVRCRFIDQADLFGGRWRAALDALLGASRRRETLADRRRGGRGARSIRPDRGARRHVSTQAGGKLRSTKRRVGALAHARRSCRGGTRGRAACR